MLLPELEIDLLARRLLTRLLDIARRNTGAAEIHPDIRAQRALQAAHVAAIHDAVAHAAQQLGEIGPPEIRAALQLRQRILVRADRVEDDVVRRVDVDALGEVGVDAQEVGAVGAGLAHALGFEQRQQALEPLERVGVLADPDELDAAQPLGRVRRPPQVPDVLEDGRPRRHADARADQHRDLVLEHVFGGSAVRAVDAEPGHLLPVLQRHFVQARRVQLVVHLGLRLSGS